MQQACDNCRLRKTKCDRKVPCSTCVKHNIRCQYLRTAGRRGPKVGFGRRLNIIKLRENTADGSRGDRDHECSERPPGAGEACHLATQPRCSSARTLTSEPNETFGFDQTGSSQSSLKHVSALLKVNEEDLSALITRHIHIFLAQMLPIMPAMSGECLLDDAANIKALPTTRLALLLSLSAATRLQLNLDGSKQSATLLPSLDASGDASPTGLQFLLAAELTHQRKSLAHNISRAAIITSFLLFVAYENLDKHDQAWFYLNQSISVAILLGIDRDDHPPDMPVQEVNMRRRIFWLLFVTER